ncbi:AtuA-related protein [Pseudonocardia sp. HH130629-09]|uniref:AtuA-related protein n=1 Tax=Pseudonocardia sp. HH130629-09 TaxID=1641402 RepID=UPI0006CB52E1|nr:hypothetical protein [Pseudonocardia sp. HH130629-09]ALE83499.1 beta-lactamase [Pseudonocardia sp. HH130629-09]
MLLHEIAHCRAGDKGTVATLTVVPHDDATYPLLVAVLTPQLVRTGLNRWVGGEVTRYELPRVSCLQFVCTGIHGGGVTVSTQLDTHGKSLSSRLLALELPCRPAHSDLLARVGQAQANRSSDDPSGSATVA